VTIKNSPDTSGRTKNEHLNVIGELITDIPGDEETYEADFGGEVDYEEIGSN